MRLAFALLLAGGLLPALAAVPAKVCATCHQEAASRYFSTGMGRSFYRPSPANIVEDYTRNNTFEHPLSATRYAMTRRGNQFFQKRWQVAFDGKETNVEEYRVDYILGSGNHSRTYLTRRPQGGLVELPISWYSEKGGYWGMSPQFDTRHPLTRRFISYECYSCHNAYPEIPKPVETGNPVFPAMLAEGIDCERCHGPGEAHVKAPSAATILNPARQTPQKQLEVCLQCHLESTSTEIPALIRRVNRGPFSYVPGQPLTDFLLFFDHAPGKGFDDKFEIVGSSAYRMMKSQCFLKSEGRLTCVTCHNPHQLETNMDAKCRSCHAATFTASVAAGRHTAAADCAGCHMPKRRPADVVHTVFTDHLIQRRPPPGDLLAEIPERHVAEAQEYRGAVVPYGPRDLATQPDGPLYIGLAQLQRGNNLAAGATLLASEIGRRKPTELVWYFSLAEAWQKLGKHDEAAVAYKQALALKPDSVTAQLGLAQLSASVGGDKFASAALVLDRALKAAPRDPNLLFQRALVSFAQGQAPAAATQLRRALALDPDISQGWTRLGEVLASSGQMPEAEKALRQALRTDPADASAWDWLGRVLMPGPRTPEAIFSFRKAVSLRPGFGPHLYDLALALSRSQQATEARTTAEAAVKAVPEMPEAHILLAGIYSGQRAWPEALREYRQAIVLRPDLGQIRLDLATVLLAQGDTKSAIDELRVATADREPQVAQNASAALRRLTTAP